MTGGPLDPLTRRERHIVVLLALLCAATRFLSMARSLWDWDEAQFVLAMRDYDVTQHHPHPPGFPVYVATGRLFRLLIADDFRALQAVNLTAAMLLFPAVFLFACEIGLRFRTSAIAGVLFAFFPNVWFFGGGAFSDVPSIVLVLFAAAFLLRGARDRNAYWAGTALLALAIGIRPQNILLGLVPGLIATRRRKTLEILAALLLGAAIAGVAFGGAIHATGDTDGFFRAVREHGEYISRVDSWRSDVRPPMWRLFDRFFIKQYQSPALSILATLFVIGSIAGSVRERSRPMLLNALTFVPFALLAWMMLDRFSISRFSIGYQPMFAIFLSDGIRRAGEWLGRRYGWAWPVDGGIAAVLVAAFAVYALPGFTAVRNEVSPPVEAVRAVAKQIEPQRDHLFVGHTMSKFVDLLLPSMPYTRVIDDRALPLATHGRPWLLAEITKTGERGFVFTRERSTLWNIARRHYFEIKLAPIELQAQFGTGWYPAENEGIHQFRWMGNRSVTRLPPAGGPTLLRLHASVPAELVTAPPLVTVRLNGKLLERIRVDRGVIERDYRVLPARRGAQNVLELTVDRIVTAPGDARPLGLRLRYLAWGPGREQR